MCLISILGWTGDHDHDYLNDADDDDDHDDHDDINDNHDHDDLDDHECSRLDE